MLFLKNVVCSVITTSMKHVFIIINVESVAFTVYIALIKMLLLLFQSHEETCLKPKTQKNKQPPQSMQQVVKN